MSLPSKGEAQKLSPYGHSIAAGTASATTTLLTYPLDLIRTRFQGRSIIFALGLTNSNFLVHDGRRSDISKYRGIFHALKLISVKEGVRGTLPSAKRCELLSQIDL